jgi:hypothetical protein
MFRKAVTILRPDWMWPPVVHVDLPIGQRLSEPTLSPCINIFHEELQKPLAPLTDNDAIVATALHYRGVTQEQTSE